jgi:hypothetical protein
MVGTSTDTNVRRQLVTVIRGALITFPLTAALWLVVRDTLPPMAGTADPLARLIFGLQCCCVAILFCFATGIEAAAHERLTSPGIDPLSGYQSRRMTRLQPTVRSKLPAVVKCRIATFLTHYNLRPHPNPTTIHGDGAHGFGTATATGAMPMGCI